MLPEVGAAEFLVIAAIALIVVGPKDLPVLMRKVGRFIAHMRSMASEFRNSFDELARQSELDELRKEVEAMRQAANQPMPTIAASMGFGDVAAEIQADLADHAEASASTVPETAEPETAELPFPEAAPETRH